MNASYPAGDGAGISASAPSYPAQQLAQRFQMTSDDGGTWVTMARYALFGVVAASAIDTLLRGRRPRDLFDGLLNAVNATLDSEAALVGARHNTDLFTFLAPAVTAAGVILAVQIGRRIGSLTA